MDTIIDGYNMIFCLGWQGKMRNSLALEKARDRLVNELAQKIPESDRSRVTIVFDAKDSPVKASESEVLQNGFRILFARQHDEADSLIEELIQQHSAPKNLTVVSSDTRLRLAARKRRATHFPCDIWVESLELRFTNSEADNQKVDYEALLALDWYTEFGLNGVDEEE